MHGSRNVPGVKIYSGYRDEGSIWPGAQESTWFETVTVKNTVTPSEISLPLGTVLIQSTDGAYAPLKEADIPTATAGLPGAKAVIVADMNKKMTADDSELNILVGKAGEVDKKRLVVGGKLFGDLTESQQVGLKNMLELWGFSLTYVNQI